MKNRRSIRHFSDKKFPRKTIELVLNAGLLAPSGADKKPYVYIIIDDPVLKEKIKDRCEEIDKRLFANSEGWFKKWMLEKQISLEKNFLVDAPYLVVVAGETNKPYWLESTWLSIAYIVLAAENEKLATLTYTPGEMDFLHDLIEIPFNFEPVVIIPIGYPSKRASKINKNNKKKIFFNRYDSD